MPISRVRCAVAYAVAAYSPSTESTSAMTADERDHRTEHAQPDRSSDSASESSSVMTS